MSSCLLCGYFPDLSDFLYPEFPRTLILSLGRLWLTSRSVTNLSATSPRANPPWRSHKSHASASISVWFRGKERPNDEERDFRFWRKMKWEPNSERGGETLLALLKHRHANRLQAFYRATCAETCQVHVLTRVRANWNHKVKTFLPFKNYICLTQIKMRGFEDSG